MPRVLKPCGTPGAFARHKRRGEKIDKACQVAQDEYRRSRRRGAYARAREEAIRALINRHRTEYRTLIAKARAEIEADAGKAPTEGRVPSEMTRQIKGWIKMQGHPVRRSEILTAFAGRYKAASIAQAIQRMTEDNRLTRVEKGVYWIEPW